MKFLRKIARVRSRTINLAIAAMLLAGVLVSSAQAQTSSDIRAAKHPEGVLYVLPDMESRVINKDWIHYSSGICESDDDVQRCFYISAARGVGLPHAEYYRLLRAQRGELGSQTYEFTHIKNIRPMEPKQ